MVVIILLLNGCSEYNRPCITSEWKSIPQLMKCFFLLSNDVGAKRRHSCNSPSICLRVRVCNSVAQCFPGMYCLLRGLEQVLHGRYTVAEGSNFESKECRSKCCSREHPGLPSIASPNIPFTRAVDFFQWRDWRRAIRGTRRLRPG